MEGQKKKLEYRAIKSTLRDETKKYLTIKIISLHSHITLSSNTNFKVIQHFRKEKLSILAVFSKES